MWGLSVYANLLNSSAAPAHLWVLAMPCLIPTKEARASYASSPSAWRRRSFRRSSPPGSSGRSPSPSARRRRRLSSPCAPRRSRQASGMRQSCAARAAASPGCRRSPRRVARGETSDRALVVGLGQIGIERDRVGEILDRVLAGISLHLTQAAAHQQGDGGRSRIQPELPDLLLQRRRQSPRSALSSAHRAACRWRRADRFLARRAHCCAPAGSAAHSRVTKQEQP